MIFRFWKGIPHTRGGGPLHEVGMPLEDAYSPHAWGWTVCNRLVGNSCKVFPTRVGVDLCASA